MKKALSLFLLFFCIYRSPAQIGKDKALHFLGGNLYGLAGAGIAKQISKGNRWWTFAGSVGGATLIGLGKEAVDSGQRNNTWDNEDLIATILGGVTVGVTIDVFTPHKRDKKGRQLRRTVENEYGRNVQYARLDKLLKGQKVPSLWVLSLPFGLLE